MTAGTSDSENECFSRRKWTSTTLSSAAKNASAMTGHGTAIGGIGHGLVDEEAEEQERGEPGRAAR